ncbi:hypothetical protein Ciccas_000105 [Cichlidogyrus casuarinus]|uniref:Uncharacterized protein n=1 Tax=Cichlidogyrus casuarinus TaxID=1844966 RepID=A0ABD2QNX6_9PLAT
MELEGLNVGDRNPHGNLLKHSKRFSGSTSIVKPRASDESNSHSFNLSEAIELVISTSFKRETQIKCNSQLSRLHSLEEKKLKKSLVQESDKTMKDGKELENSESRRKYSNNTENGTMVEEMLKEPLIGDSSHDEKEKKRKEGSHSDTDEGSDTMKVEIPIRKKSKSNSYSKMNSRENASKEVSPAVLPFLIAAHQVNDLARSERADQKEMSMRIDKMMEYNEERLPENGGNMLVMRHVVKWCLWGILGKIMAEIEVQRLKKANKGMPVMKETSPLDMQIHCWLSKLQHELYEECQCLKINFKDEYQFWVSIAQSNTTFSFMMTQFMTQPRLIQADLLSYRELAPKRFQCRRCCYFC